MWITHIADFIKDKFNFVRAALPTIPPLLIICEAAERPGLSAIAMATAIIQRFPEAGIMADIDPNGCPNKWMRLVRIMCEETVREIKDNSCVEMCLPTGAVTINGDSTAAFTATNLLPITIKGIMR